MSAHISKAVLSDAVAISKLVNSAYRGDSSKEGWTTEADLLDGTRIDDEAVKELINQTNICILKYTEENTILGCVELRHEQSKLYLGMLSVAPDTQGKGLGKKLLKASEVHARHLGCIKIFMTVISVRHELIDWYIRHGYKLTGEKKPFVVPDVRWGIPRQPLEFVVLEKLV